MPTTFDDALVRSSARRSRCPSRPFEAVASHALAGKGVLVENRPYDEFVQTILTASRQRRRRESGLSTSARRRRPEEMSADRSVSSSSASASSALSAIIIRPIAGARTITSPSPGFFTGVQRNRSPAAARGGPSRRSAGSIWKHSRIGEARGRRASARSAGRLSRSTSIAESRSPTG